MQSFLEQNFNSEFMSKMHQQKFMAEYNDLKENVLAEIQKLNQNLNTNNSLAIFNETLTSLSTLNHKVLKIK